MSNDYKRKSIEKLETLIQKVDMLTRVVAVSSQFPTAFEGKKKVEKIDILSNLGLSREIIALMVGSTPESVSSTLSRMKAVKKREKKGI